MGMRIYETRGTFNPADYGLKVGHVVDVVVVGAGAAGAGYSSSSAKYYPGGAGGASSFGPYVSAAGAVATPASGIPAVPNGMGRGGSANSQTFGGSTYGASGGGAGGYIIGLPIYGGNGGNGCIGVSPSTGDPYAFGSYTPSCLGGIGGYITNGYVQWYRNINMPTYSLPYANLVHGSPGNKLSMNGSGYGGGSGGSGGNGYGGGGGGGGSGGGGSGSGGASGAIAFGSIILSSLSNIAVTVGSGGVCESAGGKGANGVVVVCW